MKINELYIEQTNRFCDANCKITAEDILAKAKQRQTEGNMTTTPETTTQNTDAENLTSFEKRSGKKASKIIPRLAQAAVAFIAIFLLSGTTILAAKGELGTTLTTIKTEVGTFIRNMFTDNTTAEIIEQGYVYEIGDFTDCGDFALKLMAVSGDTNTPQVIIDVYLKDDEMAAANERIFLTAYVLDAEIYATDKESYAMCGSYGTKDAQVPNLYHVTLEAAPANLCPGNEAVITVCDIFTDIDPKETADLTYWSAPEAEWGEPTVTIHELNCEYRVTVPENTYASPVSRKYHSVVLEGKEFDYVLESVEYGYYSAAFTFSFAYPEGTAPADIDEKIAIETKLQDAWVKAASNMVIIVDGTEYKFAQGSIGWVNWNYDGNTFNTKEAYIYPELPAIDYMNAESIILQFNDQTIDLKESE